jgi:hypothetical protein
MESSSQQLENLEIMKKKLYQEFSLRIYLVVIAWRYSKFKLNMKKTNIGLVTSTFYSLGGC